MESRSTYRKPSAIGKFWTNTSKKYRILGVLFLWGMANPILNTPPYFPPMDKAANYISMLHAVVQFPCNSCDTTWKL